MGTARRTGVYTPDDQHEHIDNYAVVQRWAGDKRGHTGGRSKEPARAVWNRLDAGGGQGQQRGYCQWVHSQCHVEGAPEGEPVGKKCSEKERGQHREGDTGATRGTKMRMQGGRRQVRP